MTNTEGGTTGSGGNQFTRALDRIRLESNQDPEAATARFNSAF